MIFHKKISTAIRELLVFSPLQYMLDTIEENPQLAQIYTDKEKPNVGVILFGHNIWIAGKITDILFNDICKIIDNYNQSILIVFYDDPNMVKLINKRYSNVYENIRSLYKSSEKQQHYTLNKRAIPINKQLLRSTVRNLDMIINEVIDTATYNTIADFNQNGFGFTFIKDNQISGFCTSEYQSKSSVAIGIEVAEPYQQQGIATEMVRAFLEEASKRDLNVYWDCWRENSPSVKTAIACEFNKIVDYPVVIIDRSKEQ